MISLVKLLERTNINPQDVKKAIKSLEKEISKTEGIKEIELDYSVLDNSISIDWIEVKNKHRGKGIAGNAINKILTLANRFKLDVELIPEPEADYGEDKLIAYYKKFGFEVVDDNRVNHVYMIHKYKKV